MFAVKQLKKAFETHLNQIEIGEKILNEVQSILHDEIESARRVLQSHDTLFYFLENLATALLSVGVVPLVTYMTTGQPRLFRPPAEKQLDQIEKETKRLPSEKPQNKTGPTHEK